MCVCWGLRRARNSKQASWKYRCSYVYTYEYMYIYGCARLTLPSQWLVKSFVTDGAKIVFYKFWKSELTPTFDVFFDLCESQDHSVLFCVTIFIACCHCVWLYTRVKCLLATELCIWLCAINPPQPMACKVVRSGWCQDCLLHFLEIRIDTNI